MEVISVQPWLLLVGAIVLEVAGTTSMKLSHGFSKVVPSLLILVFYGAAFSLLTLALKEIEIGPAYAVWSGLGIALVAVIGFFYFEETLTISKLLGIGFIVVGIMILNLSGLKP